MKLNRNSVVGIDFDNTIISYDKSMYEIANDWGLIGQGCPNNKTEIRNIIRKRPGGEISWQKLQAAVYGQFISKGIPFSGIKKFLECCREMEVTAYIISHKTTYATQDKGRVNLQEAAVDWLVKNGLCNKEKTGISKQCVFFGITREEKIRHIIDLGCTHFIDDLEEIFLDPLFPRKTRKILFSNAPKKTGTSYTILNNWREIKSALF
jgi:hypothetical protein